MHKLNSIVDEHVEGIDAVQILSFTAITTSLRGKHQPSSTTGTSSAIWVRALTLEFLTSSARLHNVLLQKEPNRMPRERERGPKRDPTVLKLECINRRVFTHDC